MSCLKVLVGQTFVMAKLDAPPWQKGISGFRSTSVMHWTHCQPPVLVALPTTKETEDCSRKLPEPSAIISYLLLRRRVDAKMKVVAKRKG
jgi:hypothetical protein